MSEAEPAANQPGSSDSLRERARAFYEGLQTRICATIQAVRCTIASRIPVTEIFRMQGGRWVY